MRKAAEPSGSGGTPCGRFPSTATSEWTCGAQRGRGRGPGAGRRPFCVGASAGTVNTGAVDPLDDVAAVCRAEGLWFHVDGAYGAIGAADPSLAPRYAGLERADSVALDPHKWLSVPVECGCALVRDGRLLRDTWSLVPPYLRTERKGLRRLPGTRSTASSRPGDSARQALDDAQHLGRRGVAAVVQRHVALAQRLAAGVDAAPDLERVAPVTLSVVCFATSRQDGPGMPPGSTRSTSSSWSGSRRRAGLRHRHGARRPVRAARVRAPHGTSEADVDASGRDPRDGRACRAARGAR
jgi:glutamate/tyrosine decarboxylase-like PLP-dependent enzyme